MPYIALQLVGIQVVIGGGDRERSDATKPADYFA
jgi:hypothetical protein